MSGERKTTITKEVEETLEVPKEVHKSNWHDDVPEEFDAEKASFDFEAFEDEAKYESPSEISDELKDKLGHFSMIFL